MRSSHGEQGGFAVNTPQLAEAHKPHKIAYLVAVQNSEPCTGWWGSMQAGLSLATELTSDETS